MKTFKRFIKEDSKHDAMVSAKMSAIDTKTPFAVIQTKNGNYYATKKSVLDTVSDKTRSEYKSITIINPSDVKLKRFYFTFEDDYDGQERHWDIKTFDKERAKKLFSDRVNSHGKYKILKIEEE